MKETLTPGISHDLSFTVPENKTVPFLYPESSLIAGMPKVFATGFMVGLMEWACCEALALHLDSGEGSLGVHVDISHVAPTPPGLTVHVQARCVAVTGRRVLFDVVARDDRDLIGEGRHERAIVEWSRFAERVAAKRPAPSVKA